MLLIVVFALFFLILVYLLLTPIVLCIDTRTKQCYIKQKGVLKASFLEDEKEVLKVALTILFMRFYCYPLKIFLPQHKKKKTKKKNAKKSSKRRSLKTALRLLKTFKIKFFLIDLDTGDSILNAKLYPVFVFLNDKIGGFYINFQGRNELKFQIENRPIDIISSFIKLKK